LRLSIESKAINMPLTAFAKKPLLFGQFSRESIVEALQLWKMFRIRIARNFLFGV
jgi:hypothetical protein